MIFELEIDFVIMLTKCEEGEKKGKMEGLHSITNQVDLVNSQCTVTKYRGPGGHI